MRLFLLSLFLLAACQPQPHSAQAADLVVDQCALREYREECEMTMSDDRGTPQELAACFAKAETEAIRIRAGVPSPCLR